MFDLEKLVKDSEAVKHYIESSQEKAPQFMERYTEYKLEHEMVMKINCHSDNAPTATATYQY